MSDETKKGIKPEELADETLKDVQGGRGYTTTRTTPTTVKPVLKPIGGGGETPPLDVTLPINTVRK